MREMLRIAEDLHNYKKRDCVRNRSHIQSRNAYSQMR